MIHNIRYRVFVYEDEDEAEIIEALSYILPTAVPDKEIAEGLMENPITILSGKIAKKRELKDFFSRLLDEDNVDIAKFSQDLDKKIDKNGNLFLRFSKKAAANEKFEILDSGDSIHLKIKIAAYPAKKEIAIKIINENIDLIE
ncbi:MAG: RNA-binding protein [Methanobrevibacter sp.]|jgi:RNA binding exosome subunit|nr:RNA-binding protein [Methanobrevibacter sp.]